MKGLHLYLSLFLHLSLSSPNLIPAMCVTRRLTKAAFKTTSTLVPETSAGVRNYTNYHF